MITIQAQTQAVRLQLERLAGTLQATIDDVVEEELDRLQARLRPATPVRSGRMKAGYYVENWGDGRIQLIDRMEYAGYVAFGTSRQRRNEQLYELLNDFEDDLAQNIDRVLDGQFRAINP